MDGVWYAGIGAAFVLGLLFLAMYSRRGATPGRSAHGAHTAQSAEGDTAQLHPSALAEASAVRQAAQTEADGLRRAAEAEAAAARADREAARADEQAVRARAEETLSRA